MAMTAEMTTPRTATMMIIIASILFQDFIAISGAPATEETPSMEEKMRTANT